MKQNVMLFSGTSHRKLAEAVARCMKVKLGKVLIETFPDGEIGVQVLENVRGRDVFVLQSIARHPNFYLMELLILVDALKRASARSVAAVIPYFGYARQDRKDKGRVPISAKLVANLLEKAGVSRVLTMDLHTDQIQGFFDIPVDNLYARPLLMQAVEEEGLEHLIVVAPDIGRVRMARAYADRMKIDLAIVAKRRLTGKQVEHMALIGDIKGKNVLLVDDLCATGETFKMASQVCREAGAKRVYAAVTHGLFVGDSVEESGLTKMWVTDTIAVSERKLPKWIQVVPAASLFGKAIKSIDEARSVSSLFI